MLVFLCLLSIAALYAIAMFRGRFWNPLIDAEASPKLNSWPDIDIIIPARDEADILPQTLSTLLDQDYPGAYKIFLIDDHSADGTADVARKLAEEKNKSDRLTILTAPDLREGWVGKVAAMQAGVTESKAPYILFTDADIAHPRTSLKRLAARAVEEETDMTSLMVKLHCRSLVEKILVPAFVFFFTLLYPFRMAEDPKSKVAAAAGGVMLLRRELLEKSGGLDAIKSALIDDCALAKSVKNAGGKLSIRFSQDIKSLRPYKSFQDIHDMIARSAFTQLGHSNKMLAAALAAMFVVYLAPVLAILSFDGRDVFLGGIAWLIMSALYAPTVRFYGLPLGFAGTLPLAVLFYMVATFNSARATWKGQGGLWKGRTQKP